MRLLTLAGTVACIVIKARSETSDRIKVMAAKIALYD